MNIEIKTNDDTKMLSLIGIRHFAEDEYICELEVISGWLSCRKRFYFSINIAKIFLDSLKTINQSFCGDAILKAEYEHEFIRIEGNKLGQIVVSGELAEYGDCNQSIEFEFQTDQTILKPLIVEVEKFLSEFA